MNLVNRIIENIHYKNITCMLGICSTLLLLPTITYSLYAPDYPGIWYFVQRPYGFYVHGTACSGGKLPGSPGCDETYAEAFATSLASCNKAIQDRYHEANAKVQPALPCKKVTINTDTTSTSFVLGMACHIDTTFQEKFRQYDTTTDEGLRYLFYNSGGWGAFVKDFCLCPDGTSKVTDGFGQIVGCETKPKAPPLSCPVGPTNPINLATGNKNQTETDYSSSNISTFLFRRVSSSESTYWEKTKDPSQLAPMGKTWKHNYSASIEPIITALNGVTALTDASVIRSDGRKLHFTDTNGVWVSDADIKDILTSLVDINNNVIGWQLNTTDNKTERYDAEGKLLSITLLNGQTVTLEYDVAVVDGGDGDLYTLDRITDPYGRTMTFTNNNGRIATMTDPAGEIYTYAYDVNDNLISVTYPDETPADSNDNQSRIYHYEDIDFPNHLTGITDENGNRFASWSYDTQGRAISSEHASGVERVDITYNTDGTTTVVESSGQSSSTRTYTFETIFGVVKPTQVTGDQCPNCGSNVELVIYDVNGYPASETDFNGNITTYINDSRGLQTSRTEAVGTLDERTITTEWHPDFRLPTKITEPGKITNFTYDAQGRLLERNEEIAP